MEFIIPSIIIVAVGLGLVVFINALHNRRLASMSAVNPGVKGNGFPPQFGVWMVREEPVAICVRETMGSIISAKSAFVPHAIAANE